MSFLLDTCTISEPKQKQPNKKVLEWLDAQDESKFYLSVLTIGEIRKRIARLESGRKKLNSKNGWKNCECVLRAGFYLCRKRRFWFGAKCMANLNEKELCARRSIRCWKRRLWNTI